MIKRTGSGEKPIIYIFLFILAIAYAVFFTKLSILKYLSFFSFNGNPLAEDNNMFWHTIRGMWFYQSIGERLFNSDVSLFYAFVALIYKIFPSIYTILSVRHLFIGLGVFPVYFISKRVSNSKGAAVLFSITYLLFNPLHHLSFVDDESLLIVFSMLFVLSAFYAMESNKFLPFILLCLGAMIAKSDDSFFMIPVFAILAFFRKMPLRWKLSPVLLGAGYFLFDSLVILPVMNYFTGGYAIMESMYVNHLFETNAENLPFLKLLSDNIGLLFTRVTSWHTLKTNAFIIAGLFDPRIYFISFMAPEILIMGILPALFFAQISAQSYFFSLGMAQHIRYLAIFIFIGSIFGVRRFINFMVNRSIIPCDLKEKAFCVAGLIFLTFTFFSNLGQNILLPSREVMSENKNPIPDNKYINARNMYDPLFYTMDEKDWSAWEFISLIPENASVSTTQYYLAALSGRDKVYFFGTTKEVNWCEGHDFDADFIFINKVDEYTGYGGVEVDYDRITGRLESLRKSADYEIIKENDYFVLFRRRKSNN